MQNPNENEDLRRTLQSYIGGVYAYALKHSGSPDEARDTTRRVMALLKRVYGAGLSINRDLVDRLTADCCAESEYYKSRREIFRNGIIAGMPDFDTALSSISDAEVRAKARSEAENKALEAQAAMKGARALGARVITGEPAEAVSCAGTVPAGGAGPLPEGGEGAEEALFPKKKGHPAAEALFLVLTALVMAALALCGLALLITRGLLPGADYPLVRSFTDWFNGALFPLF